MIHTYIECVVEVRQAGRVLGDWWEREQQQHRHADNRQTEQQQHGAHSGVCVCHITWRTAAAIVYYYYLKQ